MLLELLDSKQPKAGPVKFIAIDGRGGSGKSTVAKLIADKFSAEIIQTDDFASWENQINWWPLVIERVFQPIIDGAQTLNYPRSKWWPTHRPKPVVNQRVTPIMILEGVTALRKEFRPFVSLGIFVDTPRDTCIQRGIERDLANNTGKSKEEIITMWQNWAKGEDDYINRNNPKDYAEIIIDGTQPLDDQLF